MVRLFERYTKRKVSLLNGLWKFKIDPEKKGVDECWYSNFPNDSMDIVVPSCWNNELGLFDYEGIAWYAVKFTTTKKNIYLSFHAVTGQAEVYLDGNYLGGHYGGFTGFGFLVKDLKHGEHILVISVDNTHNSEDTIPLARVDWFHYGGIIRDVELMELDDVWIRDYRIDYKLDNDLKNVKMDFSITLEGLSVNTYRQINIYVNNDKIHTSLVKVEDVTKVKLTGFDICDVKLWDIDHPDLYYIRFEIEEDDIIERIGFREIKISDKKLLLNRKEVFIKGINRHEDHPDWGFAMPVKLMKRDIDIIKNLGCNAIRGSHYPNAEAFLDFCDQEGLLFWEEIPMWGYETRHLQNMIVLERGMRMHEEMVLRDYHHPSIIIWGMHNECDTRTEAAYELTKAFADKIRYIDTTRLLSYATLYPLEDVCYNLVDIVSVNQYFGWYYDEICYWPVFLDKLAKKLEEENLGDMPVIISEFGAGAIYGDSTFEGSKWTENFQDKYIDYSLKLFCMDPNIMGVYIWQYCDIRTPEEMALGRPRSYNNKGIVNEYRKPKLAYWKVQEIYNMNKE